MRITCAFFFGGSFPWGDRAMPPAPNAWGSSSLLSLKNGGGSDSFGNINDRPSSPGSSSMSTGGSDLLDSPHAWGRTSQNFTRVACRTESSEIGSGSWQFPHSQTSFLDPLKAPLSIIAKRRPTAHGKGFAVSADDFPVLVSKNTQPDHQQGHSFEGRPTFKSVIIAAPERRKIPVTGGEPVLTANMHKEAQKAQLHATQTPDVCMPPPCIDCWHPPPDHPPDRYGICHGGAASCKPADTPGSFPVQSFTHNGQSLLKSGQEEWHGLVHGGCRPQNKGFCPALVPSDTAMKSLPHLMHGKLKDNSSNGLEKQPVIKKDVALLEKIKCLNIKARNIRAHNMSEISLCREYNLEHPKSIDLIAVHVANGVPFSPVTSNIISAFDMANSVSESSDHVPVSTLNVSANLIMTDPSEGHDTEFSEAREPSKSADNHVYGVENTSQYSCGSSAIDSASDIWELGWEEHTPIDSLPVTKTNTCEDQPFTVNSSQKMHSRAANDVLNSHHFETQSVKSNDTPGKADDNGGNGSKNWHDTSADDISFSILGNGWEDDPTIDSFSAVMTNIHEDQSFSGNNSQLVHVRTADDIIDSSDYEMQHSRREFSTQNAKLLQEEGREKTQQKAKPIVKLEDFNRHLFVHERSVDDMLNSEGYEIQLSRRELPAQHAKQRHKDAREKIQQKEKANKKLEELNRSWPKKNQKSNDLPLEVDKILCKQSAGHTGATVHDTSIPDTSCTVYADCLDVPLRANGIKNTTVPISYSPELDTAVMSRGALSHNITLERIVQKIAVQSCDSSAPKHLPAEDSEGQVPKQESISIGSIVSSQTADATKGPSILNAISSAKKSDINMMEHINQNGASQSNDNGAPMHLQLEDKGRQAHSQGRLLRGYTAALGSGGVNKRPLIHNFMPSAKNTNINTVENIAWKSASQLHQKSAPKHLQKENRQQQARSQERVLRERSNIVESTENITTVAVTHVDGRNTEAKSHVDLSTHSKTGNPVSPCMFGTENTVTETSGVHKSHISGVVINSSIIPVQAASVRGFTVGSIMLGDASLASLNQHEKTVSEKVHAYTTNSRASPKQTNRSGKNQHDKDPHANDSIMCTQVNEPCKKEQFEAGGINCLIITAPTQPSGNQSICPQNVVPANTSEMDTHALGPTNKELHLQSLVKMLPAERVATPCDNSSTSKVESKSCDKEATNTPTTAKDEANTEPVNQEDKKATMHLGRSTASLNQEITNESSVGQYLTEQEASSLVLKVMQELSDQLDQVEKQLEVSTHVPRLNRSQATQMVSLPGYTWGEHRTSHSQRQYHVGGQGNMWINYSANHQMDVVGMTQGTTGLPTSHVLLPIPQNNMLDVNSTLGWTWDAAEGDLITDIGSLPDPCTATIERSHCEMTENVYRISQTDPQGVQAVGGMPGMAYGAAPMIPEIMYPTGLEHEQLSSAWFSQGRHDERSRPWSQRWHGRVLYGEGPWCQEPNPQ